MSTVSSPAAHGHAALGPSSAARWTACPGSVERARGVHSGDTPASLRGTRCHALAEAALRFHFEGEDFGEAVDAWHREYPNAEDFVELCGVADEYVSAIRELARDLGSGTRVVVEQKVEVPGTHGQVWGTADCIVYNRIYGVLHILDLKAGKGVRVVAKDNLQLRLYALGALYSVDPSLKTIHNVYMHIVQPARDGHTMDSLSVYDLLEFKGWVGARVSETLEPDAPVRPGEKQCQWCPVRDDCREYLDWRIRDWFGTAGVPPAEPDEGVTELDLRRHLEMREKAKSYVKAVDAVAQSHVDRLPSGWVAHTTHRARVAKPAQLADRLRAAGYDPLETRLKPLTALRREVGPGLELLAGDTLTVTESTTIRPAATD